MLALSTPSPPFPIPFPKPTQCYFTRQNLYPHHHFPIPIPIKSRKLLVYASDQKNNGNNNDTNGNGNNGNQKTNGSDDDSDDVKRGNNGRSGLNFRWGQLQMLLDPDPDNVLAVGLTGLLTWASVQVLWQLLVVLIAIVVAGLKYSIVAFLLLFILIALL